MGLFGSSKNRISIDECCRQFYNAKIFNMTNDGKDMWTDFLFERQQDIAKLDSLFGTVDFILLRNEMTALCLEVFALAWSKTYKKEKFTYPQSILTRCYLENIKVLNIWEIMGEYNQAVSTSATMNANGEQFSGGMGRAVVTQINSMRSNMFENWCKSNHISETPTAEQENNAKCVTRVINRLGADIKRENGIIVRLLTARLLTRLGCGFSLKPEALVKIAELINAFYLEAEEYLKAMDIHE